MPDRKAGEPLSALSFTPDWLLKLANALQRTLDCEEVLTVFSELTREIVPHQHLQFSNASDEERFTLGEFAEHACTYDVVLPSERIGAITFTRAAPFREEEMVTLEHLLISLAYPLRNALLYEQAVRAAEKDALTGLGNRAAMETTLARAFAAANRHGDPLSLIMMDVDFFKRVNDDHGHLAGDEVLRALAAALNDIIRETDIAFRYGGEEFVVLLEKTDANGARLLAERIRAHVDSTDIDSSPHTLRVTVSLGVAMLEPGDTRETLLWRADSALLASKASGRNRITTHTRAEPQPTEGLGSKPVSA